MPPPFKPTTPDAFGIDPEVFKKPESPLLKEDIEFLSTRELAEALEIPEKIVRRMIERKAITFYRVSGKILFRRKEVLAYLQRQEASLSIPAHVRIRMTPGKDSWKERDNFDQLCRIIGYELEHSSPDAMMRWILLDGKVGTVLLVQRIYRDGIGFILNPTEEALVRYRHSPWMAWNDSSVLRF